MIQIPEIKNIYPAFILLSFIIPFSIIFIRNKNKYKKSVLFYSFLTAFLCAMTGGIIYHAITQFINEISLSLGLSSYGGAIGLILSVFIYDKILKKEKDLNVSDELRRNLKEEYLMHIPLIYSISKLACGFNGCCYGLMYTGSLSISYDNINSYFPIQFIEVVCFFSIYIFTTHLLRKNPDKVYITFVISAIVKAALECFRNGYSGININQTVSLFIIIVCLFILYGKGDRQIEKA